MESDKEDYTLDYKKALKSIGFGFLGFFAMMLGFSIAGILGGVIVLSIMYAIAGIKTHKEGGKLEIKNIVKGFLIFGAIIGIIQLIQFFGLSDWFNMLWIVLIPGILIVRRWKTYVWAVETCQASIWGEPLKNFKARGEPMPKVRLKKKKKPIRAKKTMF